MAHPHCTLFSAENNDAGREDSRRGCVQLYTENGMKLDFASLAPLMINGALRLNPFLTAKDAKNRKIPTKFLHTSNAVPT